MIFVTGCGFCATNGIMEILHNIGIKIYAKKLFQRDFKQHPYEQLEDDELYSYQITNHKIIPFIVSCRPGLWATKIPNGYQHLSLYSWHKPFVVIAGVRDVKTLQSRMLERWNLAKPLSLDRIQNYLRIVNLCKRKYRTLVVDQRTLDEKRIKEWIYEKITV